METANILQYNGSNVSDVNWNTLPVSTLKVVVGDVDTEWSKGSVEPSFNATLYGLGGGGQHNREPNFSIDTENLVQWTQTYVSTFLKSQLVLHLSGNNYGDIIIPTSRVYTDTSMQVSLYDNKIIVSNITSGSFAFYPENLINDRKTFTLYSVIDELEGARVGSNNLCKVVRIPSIGCNENELFELLPYSFDSTKFIDNPIFVLLKKGTNGLNYTYTTFDTPIIQSDIILTPSKNSALDYSLNYVIPANNTSNFKEWSIVCTDSGQLYSGVQDGTIVLDYNTSLKISENNSMLHLIQEPYAKNHRAMRNILTAITKDSYKIKVRNSTKIAYPNDFDYEIDFGNTRQTVYSTDYIWGGRSYTVLHVWGIDNLEIITFNKKQS